MTIPLNNTAMLHGNVEMLLSRIKLPDDSIVFPTKVVLLSIENIVLFVGRMNLFLGCVIFLFSAVVLSNDRIVLLLNGMTFLCEVVSHPVNDALRWTDVARRQTTGARIPPDFAMLPMSFSRAVTGFAFPFFALSRNFGPPAMHRVGKRAPVPN